MKVKILNSQNLNETKEVNLVIGTNNIQGECLIGRSPSSGLLLDSPDVSRLHGKFLFQNGNYYFCDLGSRNGSIVNGRLAEVNHNYLLEPGNVVRIGEFVLILEEIIEFPESPATVIGGIDATVISNWRSLAVEAPEKINSEADAVPELMSQAPEAIISEQLQVAADALKHDESEQVQVIAAEALKQEESEQVQVIAAESEASKQDENQQLQVAVDALKHDESEQVQVIAAEALKHDESEQVQVVAADASKHDESEQVQVAAESEFPAIESVTAESINVDLNVTESSSEVEPTYIQIPESTSLLEEVAGVEEITYIQIPESTLLLEEVAGVEEITYTQNSEVTQDSNVKQEVEPSGTYVAEPVEEIYQISEAETTFIQNAEKLESIEELALQEVIYAPSFQPSEVIEPTEELTTQQVTYASPQVVEESISEKVAADSETLVSTSIEEINASAAIAPPETSESEGAASGQLISETPSDTLGTNVTVTESLEAAENFDVLTEASEEYEPGRLSDLVTPQAPESLSQITQPNTQTQEAEQSSTYDSNSSLIISHSSTATETPELGSQPVAQAAEISEAVEKAPETVSDAPKIISRKYIALMAHDSKKSDLVQLVSEHQEFFSQCLTIATPAISETLSQQTSIVVNQQTPTVPIGGYQAIASLVGSGDILAVIFLRDVLLVSPGQANEEAFLRLCSINQVLFASNVPTAKAIVYYLGSKDLAIAI